MFIESIPSEMHTSGQRFVLSASEANDTTYYQSMQRPRARQWAIYSLWSICDCNFEKNTLSRPTSRYPPLPFPILTILLLYNSLLMIQDVLKCLSSTHEKISLKSRKFGNIFLPIYIFRFLRFAENYGNTVAWWLALMSGKCNTLPA